LDKRYYILGGLLVLLLIVFVAFLVSRKGNTRPKGPTTNTITIWGSYDTEENFADIFRDYQSENKNVEIKYVKKDPATFENDSINAFAAGTGPDIWIIPNNWLPKHHDKLAVLGEKKLDPKGKKTNDEVYKNTFLPVAYQDNVLNGQVYGIPLFVDSLSLFYNSNLFDDKYEAYAQAHRGTDNSEVRKIFNNPPKTWEELNNFIKYYGPGAIAMGGARNIENSSDILIALMLQSGAKMTSEDQGAAIFQTSANAFFDTPYPGTKALRYYASFATPGDPNYSWDNGNSQSDYKAFLEGKVAMMINWSRRANDMKKETGKTPEVTSLPQIKDTNHPLDLASYQTLTVPKSSKNIEAAWDLILYMTNPAKATTYLSLTKLPSSLKSRVEGSTNYIDIQNQYATSWYNPDPAKITGIFQKAIEQTLGGDNPQTVLEGAAAQITELLRSLPK
jgi:ABC-type glycerol-3-phosphate transport system substrate-binding protein